MATLRKIKGVVLFIGILLLVGLALIAVQVFLFVFPALLVAGVIYVIVAQPPEPLE